MGYLILFPTTNPPPAVKNFKKFVIFTQKSWRKYIMNVMPKLYYRQRGEH